MQARSKVNRQVLLEAQQSASQLHAADCEARVDLTANWIKLAKPNPVAQVAVYCTRASC